MHRLQIKDLQNVFVPKKQFTREVDYFKGSYRQPDYELGLDSFRTRESGTILGYDNSEFNSVDQIYDLIHPQDIHFALDYGIKALEYVNHNMLPQFQTVDSKIIFRIRMRNKGYRYVMRRSFISSISEDCVGRNVSYLEDVSWMKPAAVGLWDIKGVNSEYFDYELPEVQELSAYLSGRETQILRYLARGFNSHDIGRALNISRHTVDTHRRNMLHKLEAANTPELVLIAKDLNILA